LKAYLKEQLLLKSILSLLFFGSCFSLVPGPGLFDQARAADGQNHDLQVFDTHVHYKEPAWSVYPPSLVIEMMKRAGVAKALVSSTPDEGTRMLYREDPDRIIPFLRPYHDDVTSSNWHQQEAIIDYFKKRLETPIYKGLGEFHIHNPINADSPVIRKTAQLAVERGLYLHVHSDHRAVEQIFAYEPRVKILWAHAGMSDPPAVVAEMFERFENLWVDISIREYEIAPNGLLAPEWRKLFLEHADRITIGSDTWVNAQWDNYEKIIAFDRHWLAQLPPEVAQKIAFDNAGRLFGDGT
jgi:hypothetical protein